MYIPTDNFETYSILIVRHAGIKAAHTYCFDSRYSCCKSPVVIIYQLSCHEVSDNCSCIAILPLYSVENVSRIYLQQGGYTPQSEIWFQGGFLWYSDSTDMPSTIYLHIYSELSQFIPLDRTLSPHDAHSTKIDQYKILAGYLVKLLEAVYLGIKSERHFLRNYGWRWALMLQGED